MLIEVSERNNGMTSMDEVFNLLDVTNSVCPSKQAVQKFFVGNEKHLEANRLLSSAQYTFEDVVNFLQRMKFNFSYRKIQAKIPPRTGSNMPIELVFAALNPRSPFKTKK